MHFQNFINYFNMHNKIAEITETINNLGVQLSGLSELSDNAKLSLVADKFGELAQSWKGFASLDNGKAENVELLPKGAAKYDTFLGIICPMDENGAIVAPDGRILQRNHVTQQSLEIMFGKKQIEFQQKKSALIAANEKAAAEAAQNNMQVEPEQPQVDDAPTEAQPNETEETEQPAVEIQPEPQNLELILPAEKVKPELSASAAEVLQDLKAKPTVSYIKSYKADASELIEIFKHLDCEVPEHLAGVEQMNLASLKEAIANKLAPKK